MHLSAHLLGLFVRRFLCFLTFFLDPDCGVSKTSPAEFTPRGVTDEIEYSEEVIVFCTSLP